MSGLIECDGCGMVEDNCLCPQECDQCGGDIEGWKSGRLCWSCDRARAALSQDVPAATKEKDG